MTHAALFAEWKPARIAASPPRPGPPTPDDPHAPETARILTLLNRAIFANLVPVSLDIGDIEAIAQRAADRVVQLLDYPERLSPGRREGLVDAQEVARLTGRTRQWVYDHQGELGAIRLGSGPKPRLGFDAAQVLAHMEKVDDPSPVATPPVAKARRRRRSAGRTPAGAELLRVRGHGS
jgi:hypothetical protein